MPCAVELSQKIGQDKSTNDVSQAYDAAYGKYSDDKQHPAPKTTVLPNEPSPFSTTKK